MGPQITTLSLHLHHPTRNLSPVCAVLGVKPQHIWKMGDERQTPRGTKIGGTRDSSYCSVELADRSREPLSEKIEAALALLKPHRALLQELASTAGRITFYIGWFCDEHTGDGLSWHILKEMSDLRIGLELNIYIPDQMSSPSAEADD